MHHYQITDTATGEKLGILGFDPETGFYVEQNAASSTAEAMSAIAEDLNSLENYHISAAQGFGSSVSYVFKRSDETLPAHIPGLIMERFLLTAAPVDA